MNSNETESQDADDMDRAHISELADGSSCADIWEHLSEERTD